MVVAVMSVLLCVSALLAALHGIRLYIAIRHQALLAVIPKAENVPSVSVCIPARNETHALTQCLERVLASDYEKVEILVFDDSSEDDTSMIIRSFAQAGVRFVAGTELPEGWLGKNHAFDVLANEASGSYIVFMDVDTVIAPSTIRRLVDVLETEKRSMMCVIPERADGWRLSVLFGHLRYFWELTVSSDTRPASASALWVIDRDVLLQEIGGMTTYRSTAAPEAAIAARLGPTRYRSLVSNTEISVLYEKKWQSQVETSKRLLYPRANGTTFGALVALSSLIFLNLPLFVVLSGFVFGWDILQLIAGVALGTGMVVYGMYTHTTWRHHWWAGILAWPAVILQELILFINSIQGYYRRTITWKGRPVSPYPRPLPSNQKQTL